VKLQTIFQYALALTATFLLAACGGGGATGNPNQGGPISASPESGTFYAGMPSTITVSGGRRPYAITSSEPGILPVPPIVDGNSFEVVPNNPGVVDTGLADDALPVRSVIVSVRDSTGIIVNITIRVAQNFLTGYTLAFISSTCPAPAAGQSITPCAGGDTAINLNATFNGSLHGNEQFRLEVVRGNFAFYDPLSSTNTITNTYTTLSDHQGKITAVIRVPANAPSQIAIIRVVHVATGASAEHVFTTSAGNNALTLAAIPQAISFQGATSLVCGTGSADFFVFDGVPPYSAVASDSNVLVTPSVSNSQPGRFTVTVGNNQACLTASPVVVTDSLGNRIQVTVSTTRGTTTPAPPPALAVAPNTITLACNTSGSVSVVGGSGGYSVSSSHPRVNATVSGHTVTITRVNGDGATAYPTTAQVSVTDGSSIQVVTATVPANCP
jgi:hypothetical protein